MGHDIQNYPYPLTTALISNPQNIELFQSLLTIAINNNLDAFITPIFSDTYLQNITQTPDLDNCYILSEEHLKKKQISIIFPFVNQCLWKLSLPQRRSILNLIIGYSSYLNLKYFTIKLNEENQTSILEIFQDSKVKNELNKCISNLIIIIQTNGDTDEQSKADDKIWKLYINFRQKLSKLNFPLYIQLALQIKPNSPNNRIINRWKSQKIAYIILSSNCFTQNAKGFTVLPSKHQRIVLQLLILKSTFTLNLQLPNTNPPQINKNTQDYFKYVQYLIEKFAQNSSTREKQAINLMDYLQNPLQPYADNLESAVYQVFQNDKTKYEEYQSAITSALQHFPKNKRIVIYYIGSGRGALLFNTFQASRKTHRKIFIYAIQKNLYPIQSLKKRIKQHKWKDLVKIIHVDIRDYTMPEHPDIFLSELLGGFGDNELSPECLFWAEKNIASDTICIPEQYSSSIRPVSYQYMHRKIPKNSKHLYYTVYFGNYYTNFSTQQTWKFTHPLRKQQQGVDQSKFDEKQQIQTNQSLFNKYSKNIFIAKQDIMINGFAGYFHCKLYGDTQLSILPEQPTFGMFSWYPLFFCFENAEFLAQGQNIIIQLWRKGNQEKVWYQWKYTIKDKQSSIHNKDGKIIAIQF